MKNLAHLFWLQYNAILKIAVDLQVDPEGVEAPFKKSKLKLKKKEKRERKGEKRSEFASAKMYRIGNCFGSVFYIRVK